jgi:MATE family multidrug resistance protein
MTDRIFEHANIAVPVCLTFVMRKSVDIVSVIFVGHLGSHYLSAAGLASVTQNVTGNSLIIGLAGALSTLCSQAYGAKDFVELGLWLQRALIILWCTICVPVTILWLFSRTIFEHLGQQSDISYSSSRYLISLTPGLWAMSVSVCLQNWLHSQSNTRAIAIITFLLAVLHPAICYLYIFVLNFGYLGAAFAVSTTKTLEVIFLLIYLFTISTVLKDTNFTWSHRCMHEWIPFLKLGIPNMMMLSEWWASEIIIFMSGSLRNPEVTVSAMSIYQSLNSICFMFPSGLSVSASTIVGNALGSGDATTAKFSTLLAPAMTLGVSTIIAGVLLTCQSTSGRIFTSDGSVLDMVFILIPILAVYVVVDGVQASLSGILKGMGKQRFGGPIVIFSYYVVGIPLSYYLSRSPSPQRGVFGLCLGTLVGTIVHMLLYIVVVLKTDWSLEVQRVRERQSRQIFLREPHNKKVLGEDGADWFDEPDLTDVLDELKTSSSRIGILSSFQRILGLKEKESSEYELVRQYTDSLSDKSLNDDDDVEELNKEIL